MVPESPRWLISNGRLEEARAIVEKAAKANKKEVPHHLMKESEMEEIDLNTVKSSKEKEPAEKKMTVLDLFRPMKIGVRTLNMCFQWFSVTMCYYGLAFASTSLSGDPYSNFFLRLIIIYYSQCREREDQGYYYRQCSGRDPRISVLYLRDGLLGPETHPVVLPGWFHATIREK